MKYTTMFRRYMNVRTKLMNLQRDKVRLEKMIGLSTEQKVRLTTIDLAITNYEPLLEKLWNASIVERTERNAQ